MAGVRVTASVANSFQRPAQARTTPRSRAQSHAAARAQSHARSHAIARAVPRSRARGPTQSRLDREGAAGNVEDGRSAEEGGELVRVQRRAGDDELEVAPPRHHLVGSGGSGSRIGRRMGRRIGRRVGGRIGWQIGRQIGRRMGRRIGRRVGRRIGRRIGRRVGRRTGRRTGRRIANQERLKWGQAVLACPFQGSKMRGWGSRLGWAYFEPF